MADNIHPIFERTISREQREKKNGHSSIAIWLTGLSGSGKSTIAIDVENFLFEKGFQVRILDGDNVRSGLNAGLGFSLEDRSENIRRVSELTKLFVESGFITICSFVSPTNDVRDLAKSIVGSDYREIHVSADLATCESRDVKGLYAKARRGEIKGFTGVDSPYEIPTQPDLVLPSGTESLETCREMLLSFILREIRIDNELPKSH